MITRRTFLGWLGISSAVGAGPEPSSKMIGITVDPEYPNELILDIDWAKFRNPISKIRLHNATIKITGRQDPFWKLDLIELHKCTIDGTQRQ